MDSAPLLPANPPPCDEDYARSFREQPVNQEGTEDEGEEFENEEIGDIVKKSHQSTSLQQLGVLQKIVFEDATTIEQKPADLNQLVRAWDILEDRKRILRGKPLPVAGKVNNQPSRTLPFVAPLADQQLAS